MPNKQYNSKRKAETQAGDAAKRQRAASAQKTAPTRPSTTDDDEPLKNPTGRLNDHAPEDEIVISDSEAETPRAPITPTPRSSSNKGVPLHVAINNASGLGLPLLQMPATKKSVEKKGQSGKNNQHPIKIILTNNSQEENPRSESCPKSSYPHQCS